MSVATLRAATINGKPPINGDGYRKSAVADRVIRVRPDVETERPKIKIHPLAAEFPRMDDAELASLAARIKLAGRPMQFLLDGEMLIDDANAARACEMAGVELDFHQWNGEGSLPEIIAKNNLPRVLDYDARAAIAVPFVEAAAQEGSKRQRQALSGIASKTAIPSNPSVVPNLGRRADGYDRAVDRFAPIFDVSSGSLCLAQRFCREDPANFWRLKLPRSHPQKLKLSRVQGLLQKNERLKKIVGIEEKLPRRKSSDDLIACGDCLKVMPNLPGGKYDLILPDPPYNNRTVYDSDPTGDNLKDRDYLNWCKNWMSECARLLKPTGSIFVFIDDRWSDFFGMALRELRDPPLYRRKTIVWWEEFGQHQKTNFGNAARYVHYFTRNPKQFTWNGEEILEPSKRQTEYHDSRAQPMGRVPDNVWAYPRQVGNKADTVPWPDHPPQIPAALLERIIKVASNPGDKVFDPFAGNGSAGRAALKLGREFFGIERSKLYAEQARLWIAWQV
jgi:site-specific DNA-methyltransferase (adenine-specific)